jgi:endonuclease/exonuclease/phosphatase family metal-dependent hydrolase
LREWFSQLVTANQQGHVLLMGDFNAHTKLLRDYEETGQVFDQLGMAGLMPVPSEPDRCNTDVSRPNAYGQALVSMCCAAGVVIASTP